MSLRSWLAVLVVCISAAACACDRTARSVTLPPREAPSWAGCVLRAVPLPDPRPGLHSQFQAVSAPTAAAAWAVGNAYSGYENSPSVPVVERWDGTHWQVVRGAAPADAFLTDVSALAADSVWVVGGYRNRAFVSHWDGHTWRRDRMPTVARFSHLNAVAAISPRDVWAVGGISTGRRGATLVVHWDGTRWRRVPSPSPPPSPLISHAYATLESVDAISATDIWAVGESANVAPVDQSSTLIEHWDGSRWQVTPSPSVPNRAGKRFDMLFSVDARATDDVWAAGVWNDRWSGYGGLGDHALVLHWHGQRWRTASLPHIRGRHILYDIHADRRGVIAVGDRGQPYRTLAARRGGDNWHVDPAAPGSLSDLASAPDSRLWAVGQRDQQALAMTCLPQ